MKKNMLEFPYGIMEYMMIINSIGGVMGLEMYRRCQEIVNANPLYFQWEWAYNNVPKSVHEAYLDDVFPDRHKPLESIQPEGFTGIIPTVMNNATYDPQSPVSLKEMLIKLMRMRADDDARRQERIAIWDKHYKKYNLSYRDGY